jgi:hypothetical protein
MCYTRVFEYTCQHTRERCKLCSFRREIDAMGSEDLESLEKECQKISGVDSNTIPTSCPTCVLHGVGLLKVSLYSQMESNSNSEHRSQGEKMKSHPNSQNRTI